MEEVTEEQVDRKETKSIVGGGGGVGKTHLVALLLKKKRLLRRVSTSCAEVPPWVTNSQEVQKSSTAIIVLTEEMHTCHMMNLGKKAKPKVFRKIDTDLSTVRAQESVALTDLDFKEGTPQFSEIYLDLLKAKDEMKKLEHTDGQIFGRIIDIGGQPQLLELLPRFICDITLGAIVIDLSQGLEKYPISYFYGANGKPIGRGIRSNLTNEQIARVFLQMIASLCTEKKKVKIIIVGTHRDVEWKSWESRQTKEVKLKAIVSSFGLEKNVVYTDETLNNLIFEVNAKNPTDQDRDTAEKIMKIMLSEEDAVAVSIPVKHHKLELTAQKLLGSNKVALHFDDLYSNMSCHYDSPEAMAKGLEFLNKRFRLFYFKEFPDLVFAVPQRLLNLMTEITVYHIRLTTNPNQAATCEGMWKQFKEHGIVNEKILEKISSCYDDLFTPRQMLEVMEKLVITCKVQTGEYLMPSLLTALATLPQSQYSWLQWLPFGLGNYLEKLISSMPSDITMLAHFPSGQSCFGVYCGIVCKLISEYKWELFGEVSRNRFQFTQPGTPGVVSFIDSFESFFIINLDKSIGLSSESISSICRSIKQTIFSAINKVTKELGYTANDPVVAFLCGHDQSAPHVAEYLPEYDCFRCIKDKDYTKPIAKKHQYWLEYNATGDTNSSEAQDINCQQTNGDAGSSDAQETNCQQTEGIDWTYQHYVEMVDEEKRSKLQQEINSDRDIHKLALKMIGWESQHFLFSLELYEVYDIQHGANRDKLVLQRIEVLHTWKNRSHDPTYGNLLKAFVDGRFSDCATDLVAIINED